MTHHVEPPKNGTTRFRESSYIVPGNVANGKAYARFAGAAYCSNNSIASWVCTHCNYVNDKLEKIQIFGDGPTQTKGFIVTNHSRKEIIISFRGSANLQNWLINAQIGKVPMNFGGNSYSVHRGFKTVTDNLFPTITSYLTPLMVSYPQYKIVVTGHSLGAAIASLMALRIKYKLSVPDNKLNLYTYGGPRIGDPDFARFVNRHGFTIGRFVNENDVVPHLPPEISDYNHHQRELWVNGYNTKLCSANYLEDEDCSYQEWYRPSVQAHRRMWDISLGNGAC
ncbi:alpha/beta-hydrolase [Neoconidiobolus thromboides FSU 785]|nr:alpha/beta-hydrolase [Neoconidiobolus thromboides FSU 785]